MALGTPEYMSPEQIRDASDVDQRADMWAMGCILYELVCHRRPFQGADKMSTFNAIVAGTYEPPSRDDVELPEMVTDAIRSLLVVDRDQRLSSTGGLASVLYEESESRPGRLAPPPKPLVPLLVSGPITPASLRAGSPHDPNRTPIAGLGVGPTGKPAATRSALPALRLNESPVSTRDTMEMRRLVPRRRVALPLAAITIVLLASGALGWVTTRASQAPIADTERTAPGTDLTVAEEPSSSTSDAVPAPGPAPAPAVRPTPTPAPVSAVAASVPSPPPPSGTATITFQGDARAVWLESAAGRVEPGKVAPGTYTVVADFGDPQPARLSTLTLAPGESRVLVCNSFFSICK
jgi:serine/threonine-protein kinase